MCLLYNGKTARISQEPSIPTNRERGTYKYSGCRMDRGLVKWREETVTGKSRRKGKQDETGKPSILAESPTAKTPKTLYRNHDNPK